MEFKLNKIDLDIRRQVNEATKEGKIHGADHNLSVNKDGKNDHKKDNSKDKMQHQNRILVDAIKKQSIDVDGFSEDDGTDAKKKGRFLDIRK